MNERRSNDDRRNGGRGPERRFGDRRDSHRVPLDFEVRIGNEAFKKHQGNIAIGGVYFDKPLSLPTGAVVHLRFSLPEGESEIEAKAEVVEITAVGKPSVVGTRVRFIDLDLKAELLIARFLDTHSED